MGLPEKEENPDRTGRDEAETKLTLRLSPEAREALETIARKRGGVSLAEAVRRAIGTELFLINEQERDSRILVEDKNKNIRQLILR